MHQGATTRLGGPATRPARPRHGWPARGACGSSRVPMAWPGVSCDTKIVSWLGATVCVAIWRSKAAVQCCDTAAACCDTACDTAGRVRDTARSACGRSWVVIQFLYCEQRGARDTAACARDTTSARCDTLATRPARPRYDALRATTRRPARGVRASWAQCSRSVRAGHVCVHCALDQVLTQCTIQSHCLNHCS